MKSREATYVHSDLARRNRADTDRGYSGAREGTEVLEYGSILAVVLSPYSYAQPIVRPVLLLSSRPGCDLRLCSFGIQKHQKERNSWWQSSALNNGETPIETAQHKSMRNSL